MATKEEIQITYDVGNDFFRLWLDERMNYSCAVYEGSEPLEAAQQRKLSILSDFARISSDKYALDIGCGWGANLEYLSTRRGVRRSKGLTLSPSQREEVLSRKLPGVEVDLVDYKDFSPAEKFDAVFCICMFEHIATPEQARSGDHMHVFRDFFRRVHAWTRPGAWFAMQTTLINRLPRESSDIRGLARGTRTVLPGSKCAYHFEFVQAASTHWEIIELHTRRDHYVRTALDWLARFEQRREEICNRWGSGVYEDYHHYLSGTARMFRNNHLTLAQIAMRRIDH
jgi:cyclopropane-fatty-acyl-phospholipid synthase